MAVNAPEAQVEPPYLFWRVSPAQAGARFEIERRTLTLSWGSNGLYWDESSWAGTTTLTDCVAGGQCTSTGDLDPDPGEFQVTHVGASHRIPADTWRYRYEYRVRPTTAPAGTFWESTDWRTSGQSDRPGGIGDLGEFATGTFAAAICTGGTFYSLSTSGVVNQVTAAGGGSAITRFGQFSGIADSNAQMNALGIALGGTAMYAVERPSGSASTIAAVHRYTATAGWQRIPYTGTSVNTGAVLGAVSLADGRYYFGGYSTSGSSTTFRLFAFDPATSAVTTRGSFTTTMNGTSNGDMAFDLQGNLFVVQSFDNGTSRIYTVSAAALAAGGTMPFTASQSFSGMPRTNGVAFEGDGSIYLGSSDTVRIYDPSTNSLRSGSVTTALSGSGDLASCLAPATLTVRKDVVGRVASGDQFTMTVLRGTSTLGSATTTGAATGIQPVQLGPLTALAGRTYTIQETISANAGSYTSSYSCTDSTGSIIASGNTRSGSVTVPDRSGASVVCTFRNAPLVSSVVVRKIVEDSAGARQDPGVGWSVTADARASSGSVTSQPSAATQTTDAAGQASWLLRFGSSNSVATVAVSETQQAGFEFIEGSCTVRAISGATNEVVLPNAQGRTLTGIAPGSSVDCTIVNRLLPTTLTLVKNVGFGGAAPASWQLRAAGPQGTRPGPVGTSQVTAEITPGVAYRLTESGGPATYVPTGSWVCTDELGVAVAVTATAEVAVARTGARVTCTVTNETAMLTLLKVVVNDNGGTIEANGFDLTATPASFTGLAATTVEGAGSVTRANTFEVRPDHDYALSEDMGSYAYLGQSIQRYTGPQSPSPAQLAAATNWTTLTAAEAAAVTVPAAAHAIYRFVNDDAPPMTLPFTGGLGADSFLLGGAGLLLLGLLVAAFPLARTRFRSSRKVPLMKIHKPQNTDPSASIQEGSAAMASTKKSLSARIAAGVGAAAIATFAVLGGALPASAAANINPNAPASITIHKHVQTGAPGTPGTGSSTDPVEGATIAGVEFLIREVTSLDVETNATWAALPTLDAADVLADSTTYPLGSVDGTDSWTVTTGANGIIAQAVPVGVYLVEELSAPAAAGVVIKAQPFLVVVPQAVEANSTWNYNVHVYPKNTVSSVIKDLEDFDQEGLGSNLTWDLDIAVPVASEGRTLTSFGVVDTLDSRLSHNIAATNAVRVTVGTTTLTRGTDFTVALAGQTLSIDFTDTGIDALEANADKKVVIEIDTTVTRLGTGTIGNTATVSVNGTEIPSNTASAYFGGIELQKNDDAGAALEGAIFEVLDSDRNVVVIGNVSEFPSNEDGVVTIAGLRTNAAGSETYTIREKSAPAGYLLGTTTEWTIAVPVGVNATVEQTVVNAQVAAYALPVTGGSGQAAFMIGGAGLLLGALGFMLIRRRKAQADA